MGVGCVDRRPGPDESVCGNAARGRQRRNSLPLDTALPPQVGTIVKKADKDKDEVIDFEELVKETPKVTLCQPRRKVRPVNSVSSRLWV